MSTSSGTVAGVLRDPKTGRYLKGTVKLGGRGKGKRDFWTEFLDSLRHIETSEGKQFVAMAWARAFRELKGLRSAEMAKEMMSRILPKLDTDRTPSIVNVLYGYRSHPGDLRDESGNGRPVSAASDASENS